MPRIDYDAYLEDDDSDLLSTGRIQRKKRRLSQREKQARFQADLLEHADKAPLDISQHFTLTYQPARHEGAWLLGYLEPFYNAQVITDVISKVKGGKEANVYCCTAHPSTGLELIAAKVYRPRMFRNLRNDALYRQGRAVTDETGKPVYSRREALAMQKNTRFGQSLRHVAWLESEFQTMQLLHEAGADVPRPLMEGDNVILMEFIGSASSPAAMLNHVWLAEAEARRMFDRLVQNLAIMLACHRVHADFSAYNVLYWRGQFKIIDFPQAVDPRRNPEAPALFARDVERLCQHFARYRVSCQAPELATELWSQFECTNALDANAAVEMLGGLEG
jgi:RIO kinase 1